MNYNDSLAAAVAKDDEPATALAIPAGRHELAQLIDDGDPAGGEVYIEIDRAFIDEFIGGLIDGEHEARQYLWPAVVRIDKYGDAIIHVTSGDRAQGEA